MSQSAYHHHHTVDPNWTRSDAFHNSFLLHPDAALEHALDTSDAHGLPRIAVSRAQGKLLTLVARSISAKRALEVGTLGGHALSLCPVTWRGLLTAIRCRYSTLCFARGLPDDGRIVTAELEQKHADVRLASPLHDASAHALT